MPLAPGRSALVVTLLLALGGGASGAASPQPAASRTGAVVFLVTRPRTVLPIDVAALRDLAQRRTDAVLASTGRDVVAARDLVVRAGAARVRSGLAISETFLADVRAEAAVSELFIVYLVVAADHLEVFARSLDTGTGSVGGVWLDELDLDPVMRGLAPQEEAAALTRAIENGLAVIAQAAPPAPPLVDPQLVLPVAAVGCAPEDAIAFTHALLHHLRTDVAATVVDPGLLVGVLHADGRDPARLDEGGRALLVGRFAVRSLTRGVLVGYDDPRGSESAARLVADEFPAAEATSSLNFSFTLTAVDLGDGLVTGATDVHHRASEPRGLFGRLREISPLAEVRAATAAAWTNLSTDRGDS
jgi:hypothetical protein